MNRIYTGFVSDPNIQQPFTAKSLDFLQDSIKEAVKANAYGKIGNSLAGYQQVTGGAIISGCNYSGSGNTIYNGFILWQDELFYFPGAMGLLAYTNVPVVVLDETNDASIDPVEFSDNVFRSVHKIRRLKVVDQVSGSGLFDLSKLQRVVKETTVTPGGYTNTGSAVEDVTGATFTSPARTCDLKITFEFDLGQKQISSTYLRTDVQLYASSVLKSVGYRMEGFGAAANQKIQTRGYISYVFRNCPASQVVKMRILDGGTAAAGEITLGNITITYKELTDTN